MGKINKNFEDQRAEIANMNHTFLTHAVDSEAKNYYTCWGLQQLAPSLAPVPPTSISSMIQRNVKENKPMFDGMLRPWPVGESSTEDKEKPQLARMQLETPVQIQMMRNEEKKAKVIKETCRERNRMEFDTPWSYMVTFGPHFQRDPYQDFIKLSSCTTSHVWTMPRRGPNVTQARLPQAQQDMQQVTFAMTRRGPNVTQDKLLSHSASHAWTTFPTWAKRDSPRLKASSPKFHQATFGPRFQRGPNMAPQSPWFNVAASHV
ncbi:hypothetical protein PIB30_083623 [Stylosanthes scabra]|uniref:Uncharacterized protein n=1 Tax=Stylosanthes scabra TaxID=79078 RepID=A0ABU6XSH7_9FABA|nr:hypothetical protein [Stylosanthes scabra]